MQGIANPGPHSETRFDIIVVGAGVVGCALARRFTLEGAKVLILEKGGDILDGASKGNSGILHSGFDAPPGSIEQRCIERGYRDYLDIRSRLNLPLLESGALVVAWTPEEEERLAGLIEKAHANGVRDVGPISAREIAAREPALSKAALSGILVPGEFVMDPWTAPFAYLLQAIENGACLLRKAEVLGGRFDGDLWRLDTSRGTLQGQTLINCAGLYGDRLERLLLGRSSFEIQPRKGQFLVFDKAAGNLVSAIILPVPSKTTKGVLIARTAFGNLLVGPTAEEQESREDASVDGDTLRALRRKAEEIVPALANFPITAGYAGIRPASESDDYRIGFHGDQNYIAVGGIRSTGLSAALGIAAYVLEGYAKMGRRHEPLGTVTWPEPSAIAEDGGRDWMKSDNDGIVCHCELVTIREIKQALSGPLGAASLGALKRRTRVTMGRCQGFYCTAELSDVTAGHLDEPIGLCHAHCD